jgi:site-specific recombinase XerD
MGFSHKLEVVMSKTAEADEVSIFEGNILLYKRVVRGTKSAIWQVKITTANAKGRVRISTKSRDLDEAKRIAIAHYKNIDSSAQSGLPISRLKWEEAVRQYLRWQERQVSIKRCSKNNHLYHKAIIEVSLNPVFRGKYLHQITTASIENYQHGRVNNGSRKGEKVASGTINKDCAIIKAIFRHAMREKLIKDVPVIDRIPNENNHRPSFTTNEAEVLKEKLNEWVTSASSHDGGHVSNYRKLFRLYCLVIYYSGIRPGKEMQSLKWRDIEYVQGKKDIFVKLVVETSKTKSGKPRRRPVIALGFLKNHLEEVRENKELLGQGGHVFAHPATTQLNNSFVGEPIASFKEQWNNFIVWSGLEHSEGVENSRRTLYSLRHLYFEQRLINSDVSLYALAKNGGTSPEMITQWYAHVLPTDFADQLSEVIDRSNR